MCVCVCVCVFTPGEKASSELPTMLRAILNKSWKQYPSKQQLYGHLPLISQTIQVRGAKSSHIN